MAYKGKYSPRNPQKYKGDPTKCIYRSLWERKVMIFCDMTDNVLEWSSEEVQVPYYSPLDKRYHRYYVDFWMKVREADGTIKCKLVEVKPHKQTIEPKKPDKINRKYLKEIKIWVINSSKWNAASNYCTERGWEFLVLTEKHLFK